MDQLPVTLCLVHTVYVHVQVPLVYGGTQGFDRGELLKECLYFCMCFRESMLFELARKETEVTKATSAGSVSVSSHHTLALRTADPQPVTGCIWGRELHDWTSVRYKVSKQSPLYVWLTTGRPLSHL